MVSLFPLRPPCWSRLWRLCTHRVQSLYPQRYQGKDHKETWGSPAKNYCCRTPGWQQLLQQFLKDCCKYRKGLLELVLTVHLYQRPPSARHNLGSRNRARPYHSICFALCLPTGIFRSSRRDSNALQGFASPRAALWEQQSPSAGPSSLQACSVPMTGPEQTWELVDACRPLLALFLFWLPLACETARRKQKKTNPLRYLITVKNSFFCCLNYQKQAMSYYALWWRGSGTGQGGQKSWGRPDVWHTRWLVCTST